MHSKSLGERLSFPFWKQLLLNVIVVNTSMWLDVYAYVWQVSNFKEWQSINCQFLDGGL